MAVHWLNQPCKYCGNTWHMDNQKCGPEKAEKKPKITRKQSAPEQLRLED